MARLYGRLRPVRAAASKLAVLDGLSGAGISATRRRRENGRPMQSTDRWISRWLCAALACAAPLASACGGADAGGTGGSAGTALGLGGHTGALASGGAPASG